MGLQSKHYPVQINLAPLAARGRDAFSASIVWLVVWLMASVLLFDYFSFIGMAVGLLYLVPLGVAYRRLPCRSVCWVAGLSASFTLVGWLWFHAGLSAPPAVFFNRGLTVALIVCAAVLLVRRRRYLEVLRERNGRLQMLLEHLHDGVISINAQGFIQSFNPSAERMFGYRAEDVVGRNVNLLMPEPYRSKYNQYLESYRSLGKLTVKGTMQGLKGQRRDGSVFPIDLILAELPLEKGQVVLGVVRDLSQSSQADVGAHAKPDSSPAKPFPPKSLLPKWIGAR